MYRARLVELGVPNIPFVLDYLALELFYNTPNRPVKVPNLSELKVRTLSLTTSDDDRYTLRRLFPNWRRPLMFTTLTLKRIAISGNWTQFVWDPDQPEIFFTFKATGRPGLAVRSTLVNRALERAVDRVQMQSVDYVSELVLSGGNIRPLSTAKLNSGDKIYPLHGFLDSPFMSDLLTQLKVSKLEFMRDRLMPQLADLLFELHCLMGLVTDSHIQNLWLVVRPSGEFHLAIKDYMDVAMDFFLQQAHPSYPRARLGNYLDIEERHLLPANYQAISSVKLSDKGGEVPRRLEPSVNFAEYSLQVIIASTDSPYEQKVSFYRSFFERYIARVNSHFGIQIQFSPTVQSSYENLHLSDPDPSINYSGGYMPFGRVRGIVALGERMMREIHDQIYSHLIGPRVQDPGVQDMLKREFDAAWRVFHIRPVGTQPLAVREDDGRLSRWIRGLTRPSHNVYRRLQHTLATREIRYEYSRDYIVQVDRHRNMIRAVRSDYGTRRGCKAWLGSGSNLGSNSVNQ
ncbi:MAG: hypothetical protein AB7P49_18665 [Bdellovibrionales bacterium]